MIVIVKVSSYSELVPCEWAALAFCCCQGDVVKESKEYVPPLKKDLVVDKVFLFQNVRSHSI